MDGFVLENPLCVEYADSMDEFPDLWASHTFDPVMDAESLHEDVTLQSNWPVGLGMNLVPMDHDGSGGDLPSPASDTAFVVLHDRLLNTDATESDLFTAPGVGHHRRPAPSPASVAQHQKDVKPIVMAPSATAKDEKQTATSSASKLSHFINGSLTFPPTPPSSVSSDSEGCASPARETAPPTNKAARSSANSSEDESTTSSRLFAGVKSKPDASSSSRHPIHSPLISYQPKGSTGTIQLTEEEKRTLLAEGFPIPTRLPLSKAEERSLKKIRRKIKNKISAQESRRKKKEYMDTLEQRAQLLADENHTMRDRLHKLENDNANLRVQLARLQKLVGTGDNGVQVKTELVCSE